MRHAAHRRYSPASLSDDTMKSILHGCAINGVQAVSFTGGEPLLFLKDLLKWINWAGEMDIPFIRTGQTVLSFVALSDRASTTG